MIPAPKPDKAIFDEIKSLAASRMQDEDGMTLEDWAEVLGISTRTAYRRIREWRKQGVVTTRMGRRKDVMGRMNQTVFYEVAESDD